MIIIVYFEHPLTGIKNTRKDTIKPVASNKFISHLLLQHLHTPYFILWVLGKIGEDAEDEPLGLFTHGGYCQDI